MTIPVEGPTQSASRITVVISGSTGLIGSALARELEHRGHDVRRLVRREARTEREIPWDPQRGTIEAKRLDGIHVLINLSGESLAQRWTDGAKRRILESRVNATTTLARAITSLEHKPRVLLSGSAMGVYGRHRDETVDETSTVGDDFLASVCVAWEAATEPVSAAGVRVVHLRTGLVLSPNGGALEKMLIPFRLGVGGRLGSGEQWMSWIALSDYVDAVSFLIDATSVSGPVNMVAPNPVTNEEFTRVLARVLRRPAFFHVPRAAMALTMGEMAEGTILASQRIRPRRLLEAGFDFSLPTLEAALRAELTQTTTRSAS